MSKKIRFTLEFCEELTPKEINDLDIAVHRAIRMNVNSYIRRVTLETKLPDSETTNHQQENSDENRVGS